MMTGVDFSKVPAEELERRGGLWTAREIAQQPLLWRQVQELVARERSSIDALIAVFLEQPNVRIVLTGAGTSAFIGECIAPALTAHTGLRADPVATTDLVSGPRQQLQSDVPTLLVSFARSGNSPESVAALELAEQHLKTAAHLVITCNPDGKLARRARTMPNARVLVLPDATNDRGFAMTSSFTGMLLAASLVFGAIRDDLIPALARAAEGLLQHVGSIADGWVERRFERVVYLGSNELRALARESALKLLELTDGRVVALAESTLGFRHGPKTIINEKTLVVIMMSNEPYARAYDRDLLNELQRDGKAGEIVAVATRSEGLERGEHVLVADLHHAADLELALVYVLVAQSFAFKQSLALGLTPDNPNTAGVVNRVVQGVTIHAWPESRDHVSGR
jgi:tagatose-6-phosphate ketose/aldose isomerase